MAKILTAQNAEILTASITIKSLTVEKRQVTLALFRQLLVEDIIDWDQIALRGVGWGHVRYLIEGNSADAIHLVWQKGSELRRCIVIRNPEYRQFPPAPLNPWDPLIRTSQTQGYFREYHSGHIDWGERTYRTGIDDLNVEAVCGKSAPYYGRERTEWEQKCIQTIKDYRQQCERSLGILTQKVETLRSRHAALVLPLFDLPQLFIAV